MKYFWRYLENEPKTMLAGLRCFLFWFVAMFIYDFYLIMQIQEVARVEIIGVKQFFLLLGFASAEGGACRFAPFYLVYTFLGDKKHYQTYVLVALFFWSFLFFGLLHIPNREHYILIQGVSGLVYGLLYLKFGGLKGKIVKPLAIVISSHTLYNILVFSLV